MQLGVDKARGQSWNCVDVIVDGKTVRQFSSVVEAMQWVKDQGYEPGLGCPSIETRPVVTVEA